MNTKARLDSRLIPAVMLIGLCLGCSSSGSEFVLDPLGRDEAWIPAAFRSAEPLQAASAPGATSRPTASQASGSGPIIGVVIPLWTPVIPFSTRAQMPASIKGPTQQREALEPNLNYTAPTITPGNAGRGVPRSPITGAVVAFRPPVGYLDSIFHACANPRAAACLPPTVAKGRLLRRR